MVPKNVGVLALAASVSFAAAQDEVREAACGVTLPRSVEIIDCRLAVAVSEALPRSSTLRGLTDRIDALHGRVYVTTAFEIRTRTNLRLRGATRNSVDAAGPLWILRVSVERGYNDDGIAVVAHELYHAIELLESPEHKLPGYKVAEGVYETRAARDVQRTVVQELRDSRRSAARVTK